MDDHMLERIESEIDLCFMLCKIEEDNGKDYKDLREWKTASILISAYNKLVKLYYLSEYIEQYSLPRVDISYKNYKIWN